MKASKDSSASTVKPTATPRGQRKSFISQIVEENLSDPEFREAFEAEREAIKLRESLHSIRKRKGVTQTDLASKLGIVQSRVSDIENLNSDVNLETLIRYALALGCRIELVESNDKRRVKRSA